MYSLAGSILRHTGAGIIYLFMRIVCRSNDVSYKSMRYGDKKASLLDTLDNDLVNGTFGMVVFVILILLTVKYCS